MFLIEHKLPNKILRKESRVKMIFTKAIIFMKTPITFVRVMTHTYLFRRSTKNQLSEQQNCKIKKNWKPTLY